jgi:hypothetical protein
MATSTRCRRRPLIPLIVANGCPGSCQEIEEGPEAARRVQAILKGPSADPADTDTEFVAKEALRGVRLQIDYLNVSGFVLTCRTWANSPRHRFRSHACRSR